MTTKNAKIRPVTIGEIPIVRATFGKFKVFEGRCLGNMMYIAETEMEPSRTKMIGFIRARVTEEYDEVTNTCKHHGYINKVVVRIFHRRCGLATRLITFVENLMKQEWKIDYITVDVPKTNLEEEAKLLFEHNRYILANEDENAYHFVKHFQARETKGFCSHPETKTKRKRKTLKWPIQMAKRRRRRHDGSSSREVIKENNDLDSGSRKPKKKTKSSSSQGNAI